jgi:hypothetical protein
LSIKSRLRKAVVGVCAVAVLGTVASTAMATPSQFTDPANDPNTTNVPYLAWRGENIRLVKCWGAIDFNNALVAQGATTRSDLVTNENLSGLFGQLVQTNVQLEDWSGADTGVNTPKEVINGARTFLTLDLRDDHPVVCWQDTWASNKAGLGQFKLTVSFGLDNFLGTGVGFGGRVLVMQHQWLAGWMGLNAPTLEEVSSRDHATGSKTQNPEQLGDASGDGVFFAGNRWYQDNNGKWVYDPNREATHPGQLRAVVTGNLPLLQNYSELKLGTSITLPNQWADLAKALATDANPFDANPSLRWDIHDEITNMFGETINPNAAPPGLTGVAGRSFPLTDNVDNAVAGNLGWINNDGDASFFRSAVLGSTQALGNSFHPTAGPFDPNYAEQTLLPDGKLDAGDAPMPAARIDFAITPNTPGATDGIGSFVDVSKAKVYSRDDSGSNATAHNLFAPFYSQYIPATARNDFGYASGVDGAFIANNFNGFLNAHPLYRNWTNIDLVTAPGGATHCYASVPLGDDPGWFRTGPKGAQTVAVYTDEHGEARTGFLPGGARGNGFYFDSPALTSNNGNNGCNVNGRILGTAHITAIARYPYQKVTDPDKTAKTSVDKTVLNLFDKHLSYYQKCLGSDVECKIYKIIVAHAQDINGEPYANETVCFTGSANGAAIQGQFPDAQGDFTVTRNNGSTFTVGYSGEVYPANQDGFRCTNTDKNGNAVFELLQSEVLKVDVIAKFLQEGVSRDILVSTGSVSTFEDNPPLTPAIVLGNGGSTVGTGSNGTSEPTQAQIDNTVKVALAGGFGVRPVAAVTATPTQTITPAKTITVTKAAVKVKMLTLRLVRPAHGKPYFLVKVQSPHKTAKITISLKNKHGKTLSKVTKTVKTNTLLKLKSSHITASVKKIGLVLVK